MDAWCVSDLADDRILINVDHDHLVAMAHVEPAPRRINGQVIPTALPINGNLPQKMIGTICRLGRGDAAEAEPEGAEDKNVSVKRIHR